MTTILAIAAGAALTVLPLVIVARRAGKVRTSCDPSLPPLPRGSLDRERS